MQRFPQLKVEKKMQLDVDNEPMLPQQWSSAYINNKCTNVTESAVFILAEIWIKVAKFQAYNCNTAWDMN